MAVNAIAASQLIQSKPDIIQVWPHSPNNAGEVEMTWCVPTGSNLMLYRVDRFLWPQNVHLLHPVPCCMSNESADYCVIPIIIALRSPSVPIESVMLLLQRHSQMLEAWTVFAQVMTMYHVRPGQGWLLPQLWTHQGRAPPPWERHEFGGHLPV